MNFAILACFTTDFLANVLRYNYSSFRKTLKVLGLAGVLILFLIPASYAQNTNTKGDKTEVKGGKRESRFRLSKKKKNKPKQSYNRVQGRRSSPASNASASKPTKVYPQQTPKSVSAQEGRRNRSYSRVQPSSATGRTRNVYPQRGPIMHNPSRRPRSVEHPVSNHQEIARNKRISHKPEQPKGGRVTPNSASRSYISRRSINAFAGFWNKKPKGEKAYVGDIAGKKLRTKNFETKRPIISNPTANPYHPKKRGGDRAYKGPAAGYHVSASRSGKAWRGDIAGRRIRGRNKSSKKTSERVGQPSGGYNSVSGKMKKGTGPLPPRAPGIGANRIGSYSGNIKGHKVFSPQGENYTGNIKSHRPLKGGGSVSGRAWNNNGQSIAGKTPGKGAGIIGTYQGNIRGKGKVFAPQGEGYSGNIKATKPLKGGGSVSGKAWNNKGVSIGARSPSNDAIRAGRYQGNIRGKKVFSPQGEEYTGNIKAQKPLKGGGSVSGKVWNNKGQSVGARPPSNDAVRAGRYQGNIRGKKVFSPQGEEYTGNIKAKKPLKGGGSVSGKVWNNKGEPIEGKTPGESAGKIDLFAGKTKVKKGYVQNPNAAEESLKKVRPGKSTYLISGLGKSKMKTEYVQNPNAAEESLKKVRPGKSTYLISGLGKSKMKTEYVQNPNAAEESLKKVRPDKSTYLVDGLQIKVKQQDYKKKPHGAEGAMPGVAPGKSSIKASEFSKAMRLNWNYKHNPNSADEALDTHEPGKAFARATDYQGNIKMKKFDLFGKRNLHPDAQFVKTNKNNTDDERDLLTNFKLWWARTFKKSDTQPDHLKQKLHKPRYDKGEQGLWYD